MQRYNMAELFYFVNVRKYQAFFVRFMTMDNYRITLCFLYKKVEKWAEAQLS